MRDERHGRQRADTALRQFKAVRQRERTNMLNRTKVGRIARQSDLRELAAVADDGDRYYALLDGTVRKVDRTTSAPTSSRPIPETDHRLRRSGRFGWAYPCIDSAGGTPDHKREKLENYWN